MPVADPRQAHRAVAAAESGDDSAAAGDRTGDWALTGAAPMAKALGAAEWARVARHSFFEHTVRSMLCEHLGDARSAGNAQLALTKWEDLLRQRQAYAVAEVWRTVGRFLVASGAGQAGGERDWGTFAWRRLYLTEVAPWADYAEGDEYRFLGLPGPGDRGPRAAQ